MSEKDILDKLDSKTDENPPKSSGEEKKITLESILREYDAKKAEAERRAAEADSADKRFDDFKKDLENYQSDAEADEVSDEEPAGDAEEYDDSDMKIADSSDDIPDADMDENPDVPDSKKFDIMSQISKRFEASQEQQKAQTDDVSAEEMPDVQKESIPVESGTAVDEETGEKVTRLSERIDDDALRNAFKDDGYDIFGSKSKKKKKQKTDTDIDLVPVTSESEDK